MLFFSIASFCLGLDMSFHMFLIPMLGAWCHTLRDMSTGPAVRMCFL